MRWIKGLLVTIGVVAALCIGGLFMIGYEGYQQVLEEVSLEEKVASIRSDENFVPLEAIDEDFLKAVIAVEDHRFYHHGAIDLIGLMRAMVSNVVERDFVQGGSTITQQLAKNMYFSSEQTIERKASELLMALAIERQYTKDEVLELYVNMIYFGNGCYGISEASAHFFDKAPGELTIEEAALLAGLPQAPSRYAADQTLAIQRQQVVLDAMRENGFLE